MIFVFPGQGSQFIGMGRSLYDNFSASKAVFDEVDETLGYKLSQLIFSGSIEELTITKNAQPALMAVSMAAVCALESMSSRSVARLGVRYFAGHSVGEYTALCAAGALSLKDTTELLKVRSEAMSCAAAGGAAGMMALIGGDVEEIMQVVKQASQWGVCEIANDNGGGQIVVSGTNEVLSRLPELIRGTTIKKAIKLKVSGPFHSSIMQPASDAVVQFLQKVELKNPCVPIITNVTATPVSDPLHIKSLIAEQIVNKVRWRETVLFAIENGVNHFIEVGAGCVLTNLIKRINSSVTLSQLCESEQIMDFSQCAVVSA